LPEQMLVLEQVQS